MAEVYNRHVETIYRFCFRLLLDKPAAEDATAHVFLHLAQRWERLVGRDDIELRNWLYGEARNAVRTHLKKARRQSQAIQEVWRRERRRQEPVEPSPIDAAALLAALEKLKPADRELIVLRYIEGYSPKETAGILGRSPIAVRVALMRAIRRLRGHLRRQLAQ